MFNRNISIYTLLNYLISDSKDILKFNYIEKNENNIIYYWKDFTFHVEKTKEFVDKNQYNYQIYFDNEIILDDIILGESFNEVKQHIFIKLMYLVHNMYKQFENLFYS